jgi:hypothetical protein
LIVRSYRNGHAVMEMTADTPMPDVQSNEDRVGCQPFFFNKRV